MKPKPVTWSNHPVLQPFGLNLNTRAIEDLRDSISRTLWTGGTGLVVSGQSRSGKTTALTTLAESILDRDKKTFPYHYISVPKRDRGTINSLYRSLCLSADLSLTRASSVELMLERFIYRALDQIKAKRQDRYLLIVDEAQRLSPHQFEVFAEIYDFLHDKFKILMTLVVAVNSDASIALLEDMKLKQHRHLYGRFFYQRHAFKGLTCHDELAHCLKQYDRLRFPEKKGPTYTEYFVPEAFHNGWRLASISHEIWESYRTIQRDIRSESLGMGYFVRAITALLVDLIPTYGIENLDQEMIIESLDVSGLLSSGVSVDESL